MEFDDILKKRLRGMAVRILANIEHTLGADLEGMLDDEKFTLTGADLRIIRSEILNAAGDTTRSLTSLTASSKPGKLSLGRDAIAVINRAEVDFVDDTPVFRAYGIFNLLHKIRNEVGAGVVYNKTYTCIGIDDVVDSLLPFLDTVQIAGIKIADGDYKEWRNAICEVYLEGLGDE